MVPFSMKISVLHRNQQLYAKTESNAKSPSFRNYDVRLHPLQTAREYQRALTAVKIDKIFAQPFICSLNGHLDSVKSLARCHQTVDDFFSGSCDGELRFWNLARKSCFKSVRRAHEGFIEGLALSLDDNYVFSVGRDKKIKKWAVAKFFNVNDEEQDDDATGNLMRDPTASLHEDLNEVVTPETTFLAPSVQTDVDHHAEKPWFATSGDKVYIWDENRSSCIQEYEWGSDQHYSVKWSLSEPNLLLVTSGDNAVHLYDVRQSLNVQRTVLLMRSNASCWNPMKPFQFALANEDSNVYVYDMRRFDRVQNLHYGFVNAAMDVDFSPTGRELVAGSFDRTIRIWRDNERRSRDVYHGKRMQMVLATKFSGDGKFIISGSADMNIRVWKSQASEVLGPVSRNERAALDYREKLKSKFAQMPEIKKIAQHRHVPRYIKNQTQQRVIISQAESNREANRQKYNPNQAKMKPLKERMIQTVEVEPEKKE